MIITPQNGSMFLEVFDENGNSIPFVQGADPQNGFILIYHDIYFDSQENKFKIKTMKIQRIYTKFTIGGH